MISSGDGGAAAGTGSVVEVVRVMGPPSGGMDTSDPLRAVGPATSQISGNIGGGDPRILGVTSPETGRTLGGWTATGSDG